MPGIRFIRRLDLPRTPADLHRRSQRGARHCDPAAGLATAVIFASICLLPLSAFAAEQLTVEPVEKWSTVFGETDLKLNYHVRATERFAGRVGWSLTINQRTIARGEAQVQSTPDRPATVTIPLQVPPVKAGVVLAAQLSVSAFAADDDQPAAVSQKTLWIYPRDPFAHRSEWLKGLGIVLYDPEGDTADVFTEAGIPFRKVRNAAVLEELSEGLLVIGHGVSFEEYPELTEVLFNAASQGVPALCLAPAEGSLALTAPDDFFAAAERCSFRRHDIITELDKRLDAAAWAPDGKVAVRGLLLKADDDQVIAEISNASAAWPWLEVRFPKPGATLIVTGFGIIDHWEASPTPRFLLARIFEILTKQLEEPMSSPTAEGK